MRQLKKHQKDSVKKITIYDGQNLLYQGEWTELSFAEDKIIEYSIRFFDDPTPCFIHRNAVKIRMLAELEILYSQIHDKTSEEKWLSSLSNCIGSSSITQANLFTE